ncbi:hypothetical protein ACXWRW_11355, partial [Streptococcus pyogenes]
VPSPARPFSPLSSLFSPSLLPFSFFLPFLFRLFSPSFSPLPPLPSPPFPSLSPPLFSSSLPSFSSPLSSLSLFPSPPLLS